MGGLLIPVQGVWHPRLMLCLADGAINNITHTHDYSRVYWVCENGSWGRIRDKVDTTEFNIHPVDRSAFKSPTRMTLTSDIRSPNIAVSLWNTCWTSGTEWQLPSNNINKEDWISPVKKPDWRSHHQSYDTDVKKVELNALKVRDVLLDRSIDVIASLWEDNHDDIRSLACFACV